MKRLKRHRVGDEYGNCIKCRTKYRLCKKGSALLLQTYESVRKTKTCAKNVDNFIKKMELFIKHLHACVEEGKECWYGKR